MPKNEKKTLDKKKSKKNFGQNGVVHIKSSFNNTIVTISWMVSQVSSYPF